MDLTEHTQLELNTRHTRRAACCDSVLLSTCCPAEAKPACCGQSSHAATCACQAGRSSKR